jgi:hypothetical protein
VPKAHDQEVDPFNKRIKTTAGDFKFDHSILMAPHQAGDMAWKAGVIGRNAEGKPTGWAGVDPFFLNLKDDPDTYVIGDAVGVVSPLFRFYPKAGHVANAHASIVARYISRARQGPRAEAAPARQPVLHDGQRYPAAPDSGRARSLQILGQRQGPDRRRTRTTTTSARIELVKEDFALGRADVRGHVRLISWVAAGPGHRA